MVWVAIEVVAARNVVQVACSQKGRVQAVRQSVAVWRRIAFCDEQIAGSYGEQDDTEV